MFVYSVKSSKIKMVILVLLVVLLVLAMLLATRLHQPAEADSVLNIKAENAEHAPLHSCRNSDGASMKIRLRLQK